MSPTRRSSLRSPGALLLVAMAVAAFVFSVPLDAGRAATTPAAAVAPHAPAAGDKIFALTNLHKIKLSVSPSEWAVMQTSSPRNGAGGGGTDYRQADGRLVHVGSGFAGYFPWVHADVIVDGTEFKDVGLRYKGNLSFTSSSAAAPLFANFKLKFDVHGTKGTWDGEKTFNLHAGVIDSSRMRDAIAFAIFRAAGVPAPRTTFTQLFFTVPGTYQETLAGMFTVIEDVNSRFLERVFPPGKGLLMKPEGLRGGIQTQGDSWSSYITKYRPDRDATPHEQQRVMEFAALVSQSDVALFRAKIGTYLDVEEFLRYVAVNAFIANTDSYLNGGHNFYLYLDPADDKFRFIPWDEDLSMGSRPNGGAGGAGGPDITRPFNGDQPLIYWLMDDPAVAARYRAIIRELAASAFARSELNKIVDALEQVGTGRGPSPRAFLESRSAYVEQLVASWGVK
jgi:spore coat protein H